MITITNAYEKVASFEFKSKSLDDDTKFSEELIEIGKPIGLPNEIDRNKRVTNFLNAKMSIIDLVPCRYAINLAKVADVTKFDLTGLLPEVLYEEAIKEYQKICEYHGLDSRIGARLYTTDDTVIADRISNQTEPSFFENMAQRATEALRTPRTFLSSITKTAGVDELANKFITTVAGAAGAGAGGLSDFFGAESATSANIRQTTNTLVQSLGDHVINGYRISFPKIWSDAKYNPSFTVNIKLLSPYGDPKSIRKYIIEPIMYLVLLSCPRTKEGISYGRPPSITVNAYGMNYIPLAFIQDITFKRGGSQTSYTIYKQPLTIDVSLMFESLTSGFAAYSPEAIHKEDTNLANSSDKFIDEYGAPDATKAPSLTTLGHLVRSLRPIHTTTPIDAHVNLGSNVSYSLNIAELLKEGIHKIVDAGGKGAQDDAKNTNKEIAQVTNSSTATNNINTMIFGDSIPQL